MQAPGDIAPACHIDCALAGTAACPSDYSCAMVPDGGATRSLCVPKIGVCLDAIGGWCDRVSLPQPCSRTNAAGNCNGQRQCLVNSRRFDKCDAAAPMYKTSCSQLDPAGCVEAYAAGAMSTATDCGACGNACPGVGLANCNAQCTDPANKTCGFSCIGENYDVDGNPANGCERLHPTPPGAAHDNSSAYPLGSHSCNDGDVASFGAALMSDSRVHSPAPSSFSGTIGSAPDVWVVTANGQGTCYNDYTINFTTSGGGNTPCYQLTFVTDKISVSTGVISGNSSASITDSCGVFSLSCDYSNGAPVYFTIKKTCNLPVQEAVSYNVSYHL
jgi:hypothetical protein